VKKLLNKREAKLGKGLKELNTVTDQVNSQNTYKDNNVNEFYRGVKTGIPIAIGYIPIAITFGVISKSYNISSFVTGLMSFLIFAGASQFIGANLISVGASSLEIIITTFILNFRHFLMTSSLSQRIKGKPTNKLLSVLAFGVTDETFAVAALSKEEKLNPTMIIGLNTIAYMSWTFGTLVGVFMGDAIPDTLKSSMGIALYVMFIGLLVPAVKKNRTQFFVALIAIAISCTLYWVPFLKFISTGWRIIISTLVAAGAGAMLFKRGEVSGD
jgi:4-azaleucine resistance transporter AzlC